MPQGGSAGAMTSYVAEPFSHAVVRVDCRAGDDKQFTVVAGRRGEAGFVDGELGTSRLNKPVSTLLSEDGKHLVIVDEGNSAVRSLDLDTLILCTINATETEDNSIETWFHYHEDLVCPFGSVSIVKTDNNGVWSTAFSRPVCEGDKSEHSRWTLHIDKCSKYSVRVGLGFVSTNCVHLKRNLGGGFGIDWWDHEPEWRNLLQLYYYNGLDGSLRENGETKHGADDIEGKDGLTAGMTRARDWGIKQGDKIHMTLNRTTGEVKFSRNGCPVPGSLKDLPVKALGCDGLVPCVCLAGVGDAVRLLEDQPKSIRIKRTESHIKKGVWGTWSPAIQVAGSVATNTKDECACVAHNVAVSSGRHVTELKIMQDIGGLFIGLIAGDVPLYRTWTDAGLANRVWYRTYYGSTRSGDQTLSQGMLEWKTGDVVSLDLDMDRGEIRFHLNGKADGTITQVPKSNSGVRLHVAACMFRAGDSVQILPGRLSSCLPMKGPRPFQSLKDIHIHPPAWDKEIKDFQKDWRNFRMRSCLRSKEDHIVTEGLLAVLNEATRGDRQRGDALAMEAVVPILRVPATNARLLACRILAEVGVSGNEDVMEGLKERAGSAEGAAGVRAAAQEALTRINKSGMRRNTITPFVPGMPRRLSTISQC